MLRFQKILDKSCYYGHFKVKGIKVYGQAGLSTINVIIFIKTRLYREIYYTGGSRC